MTKAKLSKRPLKSKATKILHASRTTYVQSFHPALTADLRIMLVKQYWSLPREKKASFLQSQQNTFGIRFNREKMRLFALVASQKATREDMLRSTTMQSNY
jgi:hypothetical protein